MARKKQKFNVTFIDDGKPKEDLEDIMQREFVKFVNKEKGFTWLYLKEDEKAKQK